MELLTETCSIKSLALFCQVDMAVFAWPLTTLSYCWSWVASHPYIFGLIFLLGFVLEASAGSSSSNLESAEARGLGLRILAEPISAYEYVFVGT